jgi:hypothetical protein
MNKVILPILCFCIACDPIPSFEFHVPFTTNTYVEHISQKGCREWRDETLWLSCQIDSMPTAPWDKACMEKFLFKQKLDNEVAK